MQLGEQHILHDAEAMPAPAPSLFDAGRWSEQDRLVGSATGRAAVAFVRGGVNDQVWALRHYQRGGMARFLTRDLYWWSGLEQARPWQEFNLTASLHAHGLPVPRPVAARVVRAGPFYRGDLITVLIEQAVPLADVLAWRELPPQEWSAIGGMIRRFQDAGVRHDDVNARNVLRTPDGRFHLIDFDKAAIQPPGAWQRGNLLRLRRSLEKFKARDASFRFADADWDALLLGYRPPAG